MSRDGVLVIGGGAPLQDVGALRDAGVLAIRAGRLEEALALLEKALTLDARDADLHKRRGDALRLSWRLEEAVLSYREAIALDPGHVDARNNLGVVLGSLGSRAEAIECFLAAIALDPGMAEAHINLGNSLREEGRFEAAISSYRDAVRAQPDHVLAYNNLAELYRDLGRYDEARKCDDRILALDPNDGTLIKRAISIPVVAGSREEICRIRETLRQDVTSLLARGVHLQDPLAEVGQANFLLAYHGENDRDLQCLLARLYEQACPALRFVAPHCASAHRMSAPRRVGFLSRHFFDHSVGAWFSSLIDRLAADAVVDPILITVGPAEAAAIHRTFPSVRTHLNLPLDLGRARGLIAGLQLDVLMYADIGMDPLSYFLAFSRLAPVQCAMWGHPVTSGIPNIDYFVSSGLFEPADAAEHYSETLIALDALPAYIERPALPAFPKSRAALGLPEHMRIYVCPTMLQKLHPDFDQAIAGILRRDPEAEVVLFKDARFSHWHETVLERLNATIPDVVHRVRFLSWLPPDDLMSALMAADVALDTFHFGAATTAFLVLATGTPIVTLPAEFARGRATLGCYRKIGVMDCVADSCDEYVELAVRIASDKDHRARLRQRILERCGMLYRDPDLVSQFTGMLTRLEKRASRMIWPFKRDAGTGSEIDRIEALLHRGAERERGGELGEAEDCYRQILALKGDHSSACQRLAHVRALQAFACQEGGEIDAAIEGYEESLALDQGRAQVHNNLGNLYRGLGRLEDAVAAFREAIALDGALAEAQLNLGSALYQAGGRSKQAIAHCRAALALQPSFAEASLCLGFLLEQEGDGDGATQCYRAAVASRPDYAEAHFNYALQLLLHGAYRDGWREYEWRMRLPDLAGAWSVAERTRWDGSALEGKTILLYAEQGFGDVIQFVRYAPLVAERGGRVIVSCQPKLSALIESVPGIAAVVKSGDHLPAFDVCCSLLSLPRIFETTLETIPARMPYIVPDAVKARRWKDRLDADGASFKVGLYWATETRNRISPLKSLALEMLAPLAGIRGLRYYSLQRGAAASQAAQPPQGMAIADLSPELNDFSDDAALIANLDLVISVDTATAHLAGALGRRVWTLTHFPPEWRWLLGRDDSPWYPSMRLFRRGPTDHWEQVIARLARAVRELAERQPGLQ